MDSSCKRGYFGQPEDILDGKGDLEVARIAKGGGGSPSFDGARDLTCTCWG